MQVNYFGPLLLHDATDETSTGTPFMIAGYGTIGFQLIGTFTASVVFEGSIDGTNWSTLSVTSSDGDVVESATTEGIGVASCAGLAMIRASVTWTSGTSVTIKGLATESGGGTSGGTGTTFDGLVQILEGSAFIGAVGGSTVSLAVTPAITAGAYSAGDVIGGELTLTNAMRISSGTGMLMSLTIVDAGNQKAPLDIFIFDSDPSNGQADNAAYAWNSADFARLLAHIPVLAADYTTIASEAVCTMLTGGIPVQANGSTNLYVIVVTSGTPTYTSTSDLRFRFGLTRD